MGIIGFDTFGELMEHYQEYHFELVKRWEVQHKDMRNSRIVYATGPLVACKVLGWNIKDCTVKEVSGGISNG